MSNIEFYIWYDLSKVLRFWPYGCIAGSILILILMWVNRNKQRTETAKIVVHGMMIGYFVIIMMITYFSREEGSVDGVDLHLFSTLKINARNTAFAIENVMLFVPFGLLAPLATTPCKRWWITLLLGAGTSLFIETCQRISRRGYFQLDDIVTNTIGMMIGYILFLIAYGIWQLCLKIKKNTQNR